MTRTIAVFCFAAAVIACAPPESGQPAGAPAPRTEAGPRARVVLPGEARGEVELVDAASGLGVRWSPRGAARVGRVDDGGPEARYPGAFPDGELRYRLTAEGVEDLVTFARRPADEHLDYDVDVSRVAGLRQVSSVIELLDRDGAPRLRVANAVTVDRLGVRRPASLAIEGCGFDTDPAPPWGRAPTPPGRARCAIRVAWSAPASAYPLVVDPGWTMTGAPIVRRFNFAGAQLSGGRVLFASGADGDTNQLTTVAELYDPATNTFGATADFPPASGAARDSSMAVTLTSGHVLVVGGVTSTNTVADAFLYDAQSGTFSPTGSSVFAVAEDELPSIVALADDGALVTIPFNVINAEVYREATGSWAATTGQMVKSRQFHTSTLLDSGQVLVAGGYAGDAPYYDDSAELYDPASDSFTLLAATMTHARGYHTATLLASGQVLLAGGCDANSNLCGCFNSICNPVLSSAELYDPIAQAFTATGSLGQGRQFAAATLLHDGDALVTGGSADESYNGLTSAEVFDPTAGSFKTVTSMLSERTLHQMWTLPSGKVLAYGYYEEPFMDPPISELLDLSADGGVCVYGYDCVSGFCEDGICCQAACSGTCKTCAPGTGACVAVMNADDPDSCNGTQTCDAHGDCRSKLAETCASDATCASGHCADGVCCDAACGGQCEACGGASPGHCLPVTGAPVPPRAACAGAGAGICAGVCDGTQPKVCAVPSSGTRCGETCDAHGDTVSRCDGDGTCVVGPTKPCPGNFACASGDACKTSCADATDCTPGFVCDPSHACIADHPRCTGASTSTAADGTVTECAPFGCDAAAGTCRSSCTSVNDCASGAVCDDSGACRVDGGSSSSGGGCGCAVAGDAGAGAPGGLGLMLALAVAASRRRRLRRGPTALAALSLALASVACGGSDDDRGFVSIVDARSGLAASFRLDDQLPVIRADVAGGVEDWVALAAPPPGGAVHYTLDLGGANGIRQVGAALELVDDGGAPRIRVAPPYLVDRDGARHVARLDVEGCAVDRSPVAPWGRPTTPPGQRRCRLAVRWDAGVAYPAVLDPLWTSTGQMTAPRESHTATLLEDGTVLVTDGESAGAELYDPTTGTFALTGAPIIGRYKETATRVPDGSVILLGGAADDTAVERYSPATGTFAPAGQLVNERNQHAATLLPNGKILVSGGLVSYQDSNTATSTAEVYDPLSGTSIATAPLPVARRSHASISLPSGNVLIVGGLHNDIQNFFTEADVYDVATGVFAPTGSLSVGRGWPSVATLADGRVLVAGGETYDDVELFETSITAEIYDESTGVFAPTGSLTVPHAQATATTLASGAVLVVGGVISNPPGTPADWTVPDVDLFDPATGTFFSSTKTVSPAVRYLNSATLLADGSVLVAGGTDLDGYMPVATADSFSPVAAGGSCDVGPACESLACNDGFCCASACEGACRTCLPGSGACQKVKNADDPDTCTGNSTCGPTGACGLKVGNTCSMQGDCASGFCADGFCCDAACDGQCEACDVPSHEGTCRPIGGAPHGARPACDGAGTHCAGACDPATPAVCTYPSEATACGDSSCADGVLQATSCDGKGGCVDRAPAACPGDFACADGTSCLTKCSSDGECADGFVCKADKCAPRAAACVDDEHSEAADGTVVPCAPYRCDADTGACFTECKDVNACALPNVCDGQGRCAPAPQGSNDGGGCDLGGGPAPEGFLVAAALGLALARRRRRSGA